jgi:hypothetical protein
VICLTIDTEADIVAPAKPATSRIAWVALGLTVFGFILAVIPGASLFAWFILLPAFIVSIIAIAKKKTAKAVPVLSLIFTVLAGVIAIIVTIVSALAVVGVAAESAADALDKPAVTVEDATGGIAQIVTTDAGVDFTVDALTCGLPTYSSFYGSEETALGQFCEVSFTIANSGQKEAIIFPNYVGGLIGATEYAASSSLSTFKDGSISVELNPGLATTGVAVLDIPADGSLEAVTFTDGIFSDDIAVIIN